MAKTPLDEFLNECVARDPDADGLNVEELYGLYLSWCGLAGSTPVRSRAFRAGLRAGNIRPARREGRCPGLTMTGPAACDYLVHRELPLVMLDGLAGRPRPVSSSATERPARPGRPVGPVIGSVPAV